MWIEWQTDNIKDAIEFRGSVSATDIIQLPLTCEERHILMRKMVTGADLLSALAIIFQCKQREEDKKTCEPVVFCSDSKTSSS